MTTAANDTINSLSDEQAVAVLAAVLERRDIQVDARLVRDYDEPLRQALRQPDLAEYAAPPDEQVSAGQIARLTLTELAASDPTMAADIDRARQLPPRAEKFDPATLAIGALVLFAFHSEIDLHKDPDKGWSFRFKVKPLKESTIGRLLGKLMTLS